MINASGNGQCCKTTFFYGEKLKRLVFNESDTWSNATDKFISTRGLKVHFSLKRYICSGNIKDRLGMKLIEQTIKPILCYASEIWSACDLDKRKFRTGYGFAKCLGIIHCSYRESSC